MGKQKKQQLKEDKIYTFEVKATVGKHRRNTSSSARIVKMNRAKAIAKSL